MARAGFYPVESGRISFRRDGHWYSDEERIENPRIALLFSRSIRRNADGSYLLQVADERASITVEDTPYVITGVEDDGNGAFVIMTNDEVRERLDPSTLEVGDADVLYCRVKQGEYRARFLRHAYYHLAEHFVSNDGENFFLTIGGRRYPIRITARANESYDSAPNPHSSGVN
ncbi:MAG TPA: DUF1285 domain-containing protein [Candidatus Binataceae bacterium]|jgi:hypothetical protein|nr:DUF1285 domain-containing protein [Candidatus Binataceae bacterium]